MENILKFLSNRFIPVFFIAQNYELMKHWMLRAKVELTALSTFDSPKALVTWMPAYCRHPSGAVFIGTVFGGDDNE